VIILGLSLVLLAWIGLLSAGVPKLYCPMPTMTVLPAFALSRLNLQSAAVLMPMILFFLWNPGLLVRQQSNLPKRTIGLVGLLSLLTILDFVLEWKYGLQYQGAHHTVAVYTINVLWLAVLWWAVVSCLAAAVFRGKPAITLGFVCVASLVRIPLPRRTAIRISFGYNHRLE
jgi:hypothetical protein